MARKSLNKNWLNRYQSGTTNVEVSANTSTIDYIALNKARAKALHDYVKSKNPNMSDEEIRMITQNYDATRNRRKYSLDDFYAQNPDLFKQVQDYNSQIASNANTFMNDWMNSPMYDKMITASVTKDVNDPDEDVKRDLKAEGLSGQQAVAVVKDRLNKLRQYGLKNTKWFTNKYDNSNRKLDSIDKSEALADTYVPDSNKTPWYWLGSNNPKESNYIRLSDEVVNPGVATHELSHSTDLGGSAIPVSDENLITNLVNPDSKADNAQYYTDSSEVRARLNDIRSQKAWDVFNKEATPEDLQKIKKTQAYKDLKKFYSDKDILKLLNTVAQNDQPDNGMRQAKHGGWLSKYQKGSKVIPVQMPDGKIEMMSQEEVDALYNEGHISDRGPNGEMIYKDLPQVTIRPSGPTINIPDADNNRVVINTPNGPITTGQYGSYRKPMGHTWKDVLYDLAIPGAVLAAPIAAEGSAIAGLDYLGELAAPYVSPIVEGLASEITSAIPGLTYGNALALAGAYGGAEAGTKIPDNLREGEYADALVNAAEFGLGYGLPMYEFAAPSVLSKYKLLKKMYESSNGYEAMPYTPFEFNNVNYVNPVDEYVNGFKLKPPTQETIDEARSAFYNNERFSTAEDAAIFRLYGVGNPADYPRAPRTFDYNTTAQYWNNLQNTPLQQPSFATHPYRDAFRYNYPGQEPTSGLSGNGPILNVNSFNTEIENWAQRNGFGIDDLPADYLTRFSHMAEPYGITAADLSDANIAVGMDKISNLPAQDRANLLTDIFYNIHVPLNSAERINLFPTPVAPILRQQYLTPRSINLRNRASTSSTPTYNVSKQQINDKLKEVGIPQEDIEFFQKLSEPSADAKATGVYSYIDTDTNNTFRLLNPDILYKTEDIAPNIEKLEKIKTSLANNTDPIAKKIIESANTRLEDLYSTQWLRGERVTELQQRGLNPSMELSVVTSPSGTKYLIDKDGNVLGNILHIPKQGAPVVGSSGLALKFQGLNGKELLKQGFTEEQIGDMIINHLGTQNKLGEALYRGISHGINAVRGEHLVTRGSFVNTKLTNPTTGLTEETKRAERFWKKLVDLGYATTNGRVYKIVKGITPVMLGKLYIDTYSDDEGTKKLKYGGWLNKYQNAGTVMPADVLMDPKKMQQWLKDHPETRATAPHVYNKETRAAAEKQIAARKAKDMTESEHLVNDLSNVGNWLEQSLLNSAPASPVQFKNPTYTNEEAEKVMPMGVLAGATVLAPYALEALGPAFANPFVVDAGAALGLYEGTDKGVDAFDKYRKGEWYQGSKDAAAAALYVAPTAFIKEPMIPTKASWDARAAGEIYNVPNVIEKGEMFPNPTELGDFTFKPRSQAWWDEQAMREAAFPPQAGITKDNFYTLEEVQKMHDKEVKWNELFYNLTIEHPDKDYEELRRLAENIFETKYPELASYDYQVQSKIMLPETHARYMELDPERVYPSWDRMRVGSVEPYVEVKEGVPSVYQTLVDAKNPTSWAKTAPAKQVLEEFRTKTGLSKEQINNLTAKELEVERKKVVDALIEQAKNRVRATEAINADYLKGFKKRAFNNLTLNRNKYGGWLNNYK